MSDLSLKTWTVSLDTELGEAALDVPTTLGPEAAGRRAVVAACQLGWGDIDKIKILEVSEATEDDK
jgi:hypothetical protein